MDSRSSSDNVTAGFSLRLPNPRADVYIENILFNTPGICSNILYLISETINLCLKQSPGVSDENPSILIL